MDGEFYAEGVLNFFGGKQDDIEIITAEHGSAGCTSFAREEL